MKEKFNKIKDMNEPDDIMLMEDEEFIKAYDIHPIDDDIFELETKINDLINQKEELESDIKNIDFIINNETLDYIRVNELTDEKKYNQIEIYKINKKIAQLRQQYDSLTQSQLKR